VKQEKERAMSYYFSKTITMSFEDAVPRVTDVLKKEGFGVLTDIDVQATLKKKLNMEFRKYRILGAAIRHLPIRPCRPRTRSAPCFRAM
jgi:uncharacterized protein (DUF302 family)